MPTVILNRDQLFKEIGKNFSDEEFNELCFQFGIELDEVTSERKMIESEINSRVIDQNLSDEVLYKIEVGANRYDLLCLEGIAHSLRVYLGLEKPAIFEVKIPKEPVKFFIEKSVEKVRPFACSAILRNISFTEESLKSFIELQDKLHHNVCRQRTLVTMGTHDLDNIQGPVYYKAEKPEDIIFTALKQTKKTNGYELLEILKKDAKLKKYVYLLDGFKTFPVLRDARNEVLALPPLINSEYSKISINTKNVLIDITAFDETKANIVLNTLVTMFSVYCKEKFKIEAVEVIDANNQMTSYPKLVYNTFTTNKEYLNKIAGTHNLKNEEIIKYLDKMSLECTVDNSNNNSNILVKVPPTRTDILHQCDIAEDLAIAFGYNNIEKIKPNTVCNGYQQPINKLTELFRHEMAMSGFTEALTFALVSKDDSITKMGFKLEDKLDDHVQILKSKTIEFEICRNSLIPGLIKTIEKNQMNPLPLKLFEISDVVLMNKTSETGAVNRRYLGFAYANNNSGFEIVQGVVDHLLGNKFGLKFFTLDNDDNTGYTIKPSFDSRFFPDRQANIFVLGNCVGIIGVLNPKINVAFGKIPYPITICELDIEEIFNLKINHII